MVCSGLAMGCSGYVLGLPLLCWSWADFFMCWHGHGLVWASNWLGCSMLANGWGMLNCLSAGLAIGSAALAMIWAGLDWPWDGVDLSWAGLGCSRLPMLEVGLGSCGHGLRYVGHGIIRDGLSTGFLAIGGLTMGWVRLAVWWTGLAIGLAGLDMRWDGNGLGWL